MKRLAAMLLSGAFCLGILNAQTTSAPAAQEDPAKLFEKANKLQNDGNYKDALEIYRKLLLELDTNPDRTPQELNNAISCMRNLSLSKDEDSLIEEAVKKHSSEWQVLLMAAQIYLYNIEHYGFIVGGKFERGQHRGQGKWARAEARDAVRSLQLYVQAMPLTAQCTPAEKWQFLMGFASALVYGRDNLQRSWQLQTQTDLSTLPDYQEGYDSVSTANGAPVDANGEIVYYKAPASFETAKSDGERWRWLLQEAQKACPENASSADLVFADFLRRQFDVQTVRNYDYQGMGDDGESDEDASEVQPDSHSFHSLAENETIARLATGVKRFKLPDEFNFIRIYREAAKIPRTNEESLTRLTDVFVGRQQYVKALECLMENIKGHHDSYGRKELLNQLTGNWGEFLPGKPQAAGTDGEMLLRFRNASAVKFEAHEIDLSNLLSDTVAYLKSNPGIFKERVEMYDLGMQLLETSRSKYVGKKVAEWEMDLKPRKEHFSSIVKIMPPIKEAGVYLVTGQLKDGNIARSLFWIDDTVIVKKALDKQMLYFVADAKSGAPVANAKLQFSGYRQEYIEPKDKKNPGEPKYRTVFKEFSAQTDQNGMLIVGEKDVSCNYSWLITAEGPGKRFAVMDFNRVWYGQRYDAEYNQVKTYVITDRPVYRPGQPVRFNFWIRNAKYDDDKGSNFASQKFTIVIRNPKSEEILKKEFTADAYGGFSGEFTLPADSALGVYSISLDPRRHFRGAGNFRVEEYKKPEYEVSVSAPTEPVKLGDVIKAEIKAKYYFGAPVVNATVKYKVQRYTHESSWYPPAPWDWFYGSGYWWFASDMFWYPGWRSWGFCSPRPLWYPRPHSPPELVAEQEVPIGSDGTVKISIDTSAALASQGDRDHRYEISAEVVDSSRTTIVGSGKVIAARKPFRVYTWVNAGYYQAGDTVKAGVSARTPDDKPIKADGSVRLLKISYDVNGKPSEKELQNWPVSTNEEGLANLQMRAAAPGQYRISAKLKSGGSTIEGGYVFTVLGPDGSAPDTNSYRFNDLELSQDKREYAPGEKLKLFIGTNQPKSAVLLFLRPSNGVCLPPKMLALEGKAAIEEIEVIKKDMPNFFVEALTVSDGKVHSAMREISVPPEKKILQVDIRPSANRYQPGEKATMKVKITDMEGKPVTAVTVLTIYDKSIEYISGGNNVPDIKSFFWKWRRQHSPRTESSLTKSIRNLVKNGETRMQIFDDGIPTNYGNLLFIDGHVTGYGGNALGFSVNRMASSRISACAAKGMAMDAVESEVAAPMMGMLGEKKKEMSDKDSNGAALGGGEESEGPAAAVRTNFADTAFWAAHIMPDANGEAEIELAMPENLTTWKIRAWSLTHGTRVGEAQTEVLTSKDFLLRLIAPRFAVETDELILSSIVHNYLPQKQEAKITLSIDGDSLIPLDKAPQRVSIEANGEARVDWKVRAVKEGSASITMSAVAKDGSDAMKLSIPILVHGAPKTVSRSGSIGADDKDGTIKFEFDLPEKRRAGETRLDINYSPSLALAMADALPYLADYPYGCTEQTLNRFLPAVITQKVLAELGISLGDLKDKGSNLNAQELGDPKQRAGQWEKQIQHRKAPPVFDKEELDRMVKTGVTRLLNMQLSDGGWGWFSGYGEYSSPHTTATVVHGLRLATLNDVQVPSDSLQRGLEWLKSYQTAELGKIKNAPAKKEPWKEYADSTDALVYRVLAENKVYNSEMCEFLYRDRLHLGTYAMALYGLALQEQGEKEKLGMIMKNLEQYVVTDPENQTTHMRLPDGCFWWRWYGDEIETQAAYLKLLVRTNPKSARAPELVKYLLNNRKHATYWNSTRDTALCIESFAEYIRASAESKPDMAVEISCDGKLLKTVKINAGNILSYESRLSLTDADLPAGKHTLELRRTGSGPLYSNAYLSYFSLEDFITKTGLEIKVERKYYKLVETKKDQKAAGAHGQVLDQKAVAYERVPLSSGAEIRSGDLVEIEMLIESKNDYEYILFEDMKPAGCEPVEVRSGYNGNEMGAYVEFRDTKVCFFVRELARGTHSVSYRMRAETPGAFSALPTQGWGMYAPELRANSDEIKIKIAERRE
ncbi:MAG: hypothetical protein A2X49_17130 [Lentisphaerae bacterium GWF2_52_8]|nr:MAG: hypothetical protein A2X49_17130 [Lentisphaerae bacterium GWF2_52_8]